MNNVDVAAIEKFVQEVRQNPSVAQKEKVVTGSWNFKKGNPQYEATVEFIEVERVAKLAEERYPGMECMKREIPHTVEIKPA